MSKGFVPFVQLSVDDFLEKKRRAELFDELVGALEAGVDVIKGDLVGVDWKQACASFIVKARAALSKARKEQT
jgi:hypothetical protein